jgi:hypothetical protein
MDDASDEGGAMKQLVIEEVEKCADLNLLDLIYKILVCGT